MLKRLTLPVFYYGEDGEKYEDMGMDVEPEIKMTIFYRVDAIQPSMDPDKCTINVGGADFVIAHTMKDVAAMVEAAFS